MIPSGMKTWLYSHTPVTPQNTESLLILAMEWMIEIRSTSDDDVEGFQASRLDAPQKIVSVSVQKLAQTLS